MVRTLKKSERTLPVPVTTPTQSGDARPRIGYRIAMQVQDPSGHTWRVSRRWVPWPRHAQHHGFPDAERPERSSGATVLSVLLVMSIFVVPVLTLAVLVALPLLLLLLLVPLASLVRIPWGKHWYVEVFQDKEPWSEEDAGDWESSGRRIKVLAKALERGELPERTLGADPPAVA